MGVQIGEWEVSYSSRGNPTYRLEMWHRELKKHRVLKGNDASIIERKARMQAQDWDEKWALAQQRESQKREQQRKKDHDQAQKEEAVQRTDEASSALTSLEQILAHTLSVDDTIDWAELKDDSVFPKPKPSLPKKPTPPKPASPPAEPVQASPEYQPKLSLLDKLIPSRREAKRKEATEEYAKDHAFWASAVEEAKEETTRRQEEYQAQVEGMDRKHAEAVSQWEKERGEFQEEQNKTNEAVDRKRVLYQSKDREAVLDYCDMVLSNSEYPDWMPKEWELDYNPETGILILDYALPAVDALPTLSEVRYIQSRDEFTEKHISEAQTKRLYDSVLYQTALRTIHELFEADVVDALQAVVFNGVVTSIDRSTGHETTACILSVQAKREEFLPINLANVDPRACFKSLKGVGSSKLHSLTPVAPIAQMSREDSRFVAARGIADNLDDSVNLAAMDWEDFEHLIREVFEQEFATGGGEVKVTRASRDGGVDAIAFDPDPIRGGKIVIQAKRYTNTVGVAAVRDLYGTVVNEGANRGILVTTSDYGPDAYSFAKDKPITLLSGANLLHLLEKHGRRAKIDIGAARELLR
jgi:restriction system protein